MPIVLKVLSPEKEVLEVKECKSVTLPTEDGLITVLPKHASIVTNVVNGELIARPLEGKEVSLAVGGGFATITGDVVTVLVDYGVNSEALDEEQIKAAKAKAEELLKEKNDARGTAMAQASLARSLMELKLVRKKRKN